MAAGDSWESWLVDGLAAHLVAHSGIAGIAYRTDGTAYAAGEVAIVDRDVPNEPDRLIVITPYGGADPADGLGDTEQPVQIRFRGTSDPRVVRDLASEVYDLLHASGRQVWGTTGREVYVVDVRRQSYTSLGKDGQQRWEISHNYTVRAMRPTIHRSE